MKESHSTAATFTNRMAAENYIRDLESQGIRDQDICVLLPRGVTAEEFESTMGVGREASGSLLDRLASLFGGRNCLSEFGIEDRQQDYLKERRDQGDYVVAVRCDGMCSNIHPLVNRYGGQMPTYQGYEVEGYESKDYRGEQR